MKKHNNALAQDPMTNLSSISCDGASSLRVCKYSKVYHSDFRIQLHFDFAKLQLVRCSKTTYIAAAQPRNQEEDKKTEHFQSGSLIPIEF